MSNSLDRLTLCLLGGVLLLTACSPGKQRPAGLVFRSDAVLNKMFRLGEKSQPYYFDLLPGQRLTVVVEQKNLDVEAVLADPLGHTVLDVDSLNGSWGNELVEWIASTPGRYRLSIQRAESSRAGYYRMSIHFATQTSPGDRARAQAVALLSSARREASLPQALAASRAAIRLMREAGDPEQEALAWLAAGDLEGRSGARDLEIAAYRQALELLRRHSIPRLRLTTLHRLGRACRLAGDLRQARKAQSEALSLAHALHDAHLEAVSLQNLAVIADAGHDPLEALRLYRQALGALSPAEHPADVATVLHNMGTTQSLFGQHGEALDSFTEALRLRRQLGDRKGMAATLTELGWSHSLRGETGEAIASYQEALSLGRQAGDEATPLSAATLDRLGSAYRSLDRWEDALSAYQRSLAISRRLGQRRDEANTRVNLAELLVDQGRTTEARQALREAVDLFSQLSDLDPHTGIHLLYLRARVEEEEGDMASALRDSAQVLLRLEVMRQGLDSQTLSLPFFATRRVYLDYRLNLLMEMHRREPRRGWDRLALAAAEAGRSRGLLETLIARGASVPPLSGETRRRVARLHEQLNALELARLTAARSPAETGRAPLNSERALVEELAEITKPRRGHKGGQALPALDAAAIQQLLDDGTTLLYYHLGEKRSYLWWVDRRAVEAFTLPARADVAALSRELARRLPEARFGDRRDPGRLAARRLGLVLLGPVAGSLASQRLIVVPDGALAALPFGALLDPRTAMPLIVRHEIAQVPSAGVLSTLRRRAAARQRPTRGEVAVLADPVFQAEDPRVHSARGSAPQATGSGQDEDRRLLTRSARDLGLIGLLRLSSSRREGEEIASFVSPSARLLALDFAASRATVTHGRLEEFRILHFATHALLHPLPELSGLVLSLVDPQGKPQDGFLRAHDIATLNLPADLVVLSACRTAIGPEALGEGLLSLPRSLMEAGATRVVVSFWNVDDESTALFMSRFYRALLVEHLPAAAALRTTQLWMAGQPAWSAPRYWAGFELQGDWLESASPAGIPLRRPSHPSPAVRPAFQPRETERRSPMPDTPPDDKGTTTKPAFGDKNPRPVPDGGSGTDSNQPGTKSGFPEKNPKSS